MPFAVENFNEKIKEKANKSTKTLQNGIPTVKKWEKPY